MTVATDTVDPSAVDELERRWGLVVRLRDAVSSQGIWRSKEEARESFAELRARAAAGKTTVDDRPPVVEGDRSIPLAEYIAYDKGLYELEVAALAWLLDARAAFEYTDRPDIVIPAELAAAAKKYADTKMPGGQKAGDQ